MKLEKRIFAFLLLLIPASSFGQFKVDTTWRKGYTLGALANLSSPFSVLGVEAGIQRRRQSFNVGLGIDPWSGKKPLGSWGVNFNYNYFPNSFRNRFDLFFDFNFVSGFHYHTYNVYDPYPTVVGTKKHFDAFQSCNIGFGFITNFSQHIFLKSSLGLGRAIYNFHLTDTEASYNIRLALGYRF